MYSLFVAQVTDVRDWASESDAVQALRGALTPIHNWVKVINANKNETLLLSLINQWQQRNFQDLPFHILFTFTSWRPPLFFLSMLQEKANVMKDQTFSDMYESVKSSVQNMDEKIGTWLEEKTA